MKNFILATAVAVLVSVGAVSAQDVFVGGQYVRVNPDVHRPNLTFDKNTDSLGVVADLTSYKTENVGLTAEGSANFNTGDQESQLYTAMGGVTLKSRRWTSAQPFVKGVVGVGILNAGDRFSNFSAADVSPAFKTSVGLDLGKGKVRYRLFEVGYLQTRFFGQRQDNVTVGTGIVF